MGRRRDAPPGVGRSGLIDEYEFLVQPVLAGYGPTLLAGLRERIQLELVDRHELRSGQSPCDTGPRELRLEVICPRAEARSRRWSVGGPRSLTLPRCPLVAYAPTSDGCSQRRPFSDVLAPHCGCR